MKIISIGHYFPHFSKYNGYDIIHKKFKCSINFRSFRFIDKLFSNYLNIWYNSSDLINHAILKFVLFINPKSVIYFAYGEHALRYISKIRKAYPHAKFYCTLHQPFDFFKLKNRLLKLHDFDKIIVLNKIEESSFKPLFDKKVYFLPHPVNIEKFKISINDVDDYVLIVGSNYRDLDLYVKFLNEVILNTNFSIKIVSNFELYSILSRNNSDRISYITNVNIDHLVLLYSKAKFSCVFTTKFTANNAVLESLACGTPCVINITSFDDWFYDSIDLKPLIYNDNFKDVISNVDRLTKDNIRDKMCTYMKIFDSKFHEILEI